MNAKRAINMRLMTKFLQESQTGDNAGCHNLCWFQSVRASEIGKLTSSIRREDERCSREQEGGALRAATRGPGKRKMTRLKRTCTTHVVLANQQTEAPTKAVVTCMCQFRSPLTPRGLRVEATEDTNLTSLFLFPPSPMTPAATRSTHG